jgi:hypothetical protein
MSEATAPGTGATITTATAPASHETLGQRVGDFFHRADQDAEALIASVPGFNAAVKAHAGVVFDVAGDVLALAKIADPAISPALVPVSAALTALEAKVLAMAQSAAQMASAVTAASGKPA